MKKNKNRRPSPESKRPGWRNIGRSLVVVVIGSDELAAVVGRDPDVIVVHFDILPTNAHELRAFSPAVVDLAVLDATTMQNERMMKFAQSLRHRMLASVIVLKPDHFGEAIFRRWLGIVKEDESPWQRYLWMAIAVAAQETWALSWITMTRRTARRRLQAPSLPSDATLRPRPPSRTAPWSPTPDLLAQLVEAYDE